MYEYCENNPLNKSDYLGLWDIKRNGEAWAIATAEEGDTFDSLAVEVQLDTSDYKIWAHTQHEQPKPKCDYEIPNTIYYHHDEFTFWRPLLLDLWRSQNRKDAKNHERNGFKVVWIEKNVLSGAIKAALSDEYLYQYFYTGHGVGGGSVNDGHIIANRYTKHGINLLRINSCGSADKTSGAGEKKYYERNMWEWNVATRGWFVGYEGNINVLTEALGWRIVRGNNRNGPILK